ncbi:hypothetical protein FOA52_008376 [Chlamydomonas sp. UWO 241]|nr:hypothetical protein FOA52_008376 [Chlamydomonas sp. UWO 241]
MGCGGSKEKSDADNPGAAGGVVSKMLKLDHILKLDVASGDIRDTFTFGKVLGKGNFGVVHLVTEKSSGLQYACKSISKRKMVNGEDVEDVQREVQIMMHLAGNVNVVQMFSSYEDSRYIHFVLECCEGGELFDRIAERGTFSEHAAAEYMRSIVSVVNHCHNMVG